MRFSRQHTQTHDADPTPSDRPPIAPLVMAFLMFAAAYVFRTSFLWEGQRYFVLVDDQMISMRYAANLADGLGLVWNPGERIEGFTNLAWVLWMALFHALEVPRPLTSLCIQVSGALLAVLNLYLLRRLASESGLSRAASVIALVLTAFYFPLVTWILQGTEVSLLTACTMLAALLAIQLRAQPNRIWPLLIVLGFMVLIRPDTVVVSAAIIGYLAIHQSGRRAAVAAAAGLTLCVVLVSAWRWSYFGDLLPNTYYLKLTGFPLHLRIARGAFVASRFLFMLSPLLLLAVYAGYGKRRQLSTVCMAVFGAQLAYSVYVGGDAWEWWGGSNRYIAIAMPLLFVVLAPSLACVLPEGPQSRSLAWPVAFVLAFMTSATAMMQWPDHALPRLVLLEQPWQSEVDRANVVAALRIKERTTDDAVIAVVWAGSLGYFSERRVIDLLGKMDRRIAHQPGHRNGADYEWSTFLPGHMKWDYDYSIGQLQPDAVQAPLWNAFTISDPWQPPGYELREPVWFYRSGSPRVKWETLPSQ